MGFDFIEDLTVITLAAGLLGAFCKRINLSVIVGYITAGILIGPYTPLFKLVHDADRIQTLSQLGLVFLMFSIGLELGLSKMKKLGLKMFLASSLGAIFVFSSTQAISAFMIWSSTQTLFMAAIFMASSSAVISKMLKDLKLNHEKSGQQALGISILEDVVVIVMVAILGSQMASSGTSVRQVITGMSGVVAFIVMAMLVFVPKLINRLQEKADPELQTITITGLLFLMGLAAAWTGYSLALGAFLLGSVVAELPQHRQIENSFQGVKDIFSSVFFVSIGMMVDLKMILEVWPEIIVLGLFVLIARPISIGAALVITGNDLKTSRRAGLAISPLGEFSFIIAQMGVAAGFLPKNYYALSIGVSFFTILVSPLVNRKANCITNFIEKIEPKAWINFVETYQRLLDQIIEAPGHKLWWKKGLPYFIKIALESMIIIGLLIFAETIYKFIESNEISANLDKNIFPIVFWMTFGLILLFPLIGIARAVDSLSKIFAKTIQGQTELSDERIRFLIHALAVSFGLLVFSNMMPFWALPVSGWISVLVAVFVMIVVFYKKMIVLQSDINESVEDVLNNEHTTKSSTNWGVKLHEIELPDRFISAGKTIKQLDIRKNYNCSVVEINRQGHLIIAPEANTSVFSGDRLLVTGKKEDLTRLSEDIKTQTKSDSSLKFDHAHFETIIVSDESPVIGKTLKQLQISEKTGTIVIGIKGQNNISNTAINGEETLYAKDEILVVGDTTQISKLKTFLKGL